MHRPGNYDRNLQEVMTMNAAHSNAEVICLITAPNSIQAHNWERALRAEGIGSQLVGDFLGLGIGDISGIQPEIWVTRQDWIRAKRVLRNHERIIDLFEVRIP
jgi:hypothetical protein